jgi:hypothetical protein
MAGGEASGTDAITTGNITTTVDNDYLFAAGVILGELIAAGTGYTSRAVQDGTVFVKSRSEDRIQTTAGAIAGTFSNTVGANWVCGVMAFQPASGVTVAQEIPALLQALSGGCVIGRVDA